ncbi:hypothetical protein P7K49_009686, partial [Saguinus oedipus]
MDYTSQQAPRAGCGSLRSSFAPPAGAKARSFRICGAPEEKRTFFEEEKRKHTVEDKALRNRRFSRALAQVVVVGGRGASPVGTERMFEDEPHAEGAAVVAAAGEALQALCQELNLDEGSAAEALDDFTAIRGNY